MNRSDHPALIALVAILKMYICVLFVPLAGTKLQRSKVHVLNVWWAEKHQRKKPRLLVPYVIMVNNRRGPEMAINGDKDGDGEAKCIHTQRDQCPWWEVDLGRLAVINTIEVWNREDVPIDVSQGEDYFTKRLFPCWMLVSTDPFPEGTGGQVR